MANPEHLDLLKQGADTWNRWYKEHYWGTAPDLRGADLSKIDLSDVRLSFARLEETCFRGSNLQGAFFVQSCLIHADLSHTNLREDHLDRAWLLDANLQGAQLNAAKIRKASLARVNLNEAVLSHTSLYPQRGTGKSLLGSTKLGSIQHYSPYQPRQRTASQGEGWTLSTHHVANQRLLWLARSRCLPESIQPLVRGSSLRNEPEKQRGACASISASARGTDCGGIV